MSDNWHKVSCLEERTEGETFLTSIVICSLLKYDKKKNRTGEDNGHFLWLVANEYYLIIRLFISLRKSYKFVFPF